MAIHVCYLAVLATLVALRAAATPRFHVPGKWSSYPLNTLYCNACGLVSDGVSLHLKEPGLDFDSQFGYRIDGQGNKIRKSSAAVKVADMLHHFCDTWKSTFRVAKRKEGNLYLVEKKKLNESSRLQPRLQKTTTRGHKAMHDMCVEITEHFEEYLLSLKPSHDPVLMSGRFCLSKYRVCTKPMLDRDIDLVRLKKSPAEEKQEKEKGTVPAGDTGWKRRVQDALHDVQVELRKYFEMVNEWTQEQLGVEATYPVAVAVTIALYSVFRLFSAEPPKEHES